jgi:BlaI family penicillinase repressor
MVTAISGRFDHHDQRCEDAARDCTNLQLAILRVIWSHSSITAERVREVLHAKRSLKNSTVRTLLRRLEERGYLRHSRAGRAFVYRTVVTPTRFAAEAACAIIAKWCSGSVDEFLNMLVAENVLTDDHIRRVIRTLKGARRRMRSGVRGPLMSKKGVNAGKGGKDFRFRVAR